MNTEYPSTRRCTLEVRSIGPGGWQTTLHRSRLPPVTLELAVDEADRETPSVLDGPAAAALPFAMLDGGDLFVEGPVTRGALKNFTEFSEVWHSWNPSRLHRLRIGAASITDGPGYTGPRHAIAAWSGSMRSTHTLIRHLTASVPGAFALQGALRVVGFCPDDDAASLTSARSALTELGLPLRVVRIRSDAPRITDPEIGALPWIAAALHAVAGGRAVGLHARSHRCTANLRYPRPGPDPADIWSGDAQPIYADGGSATLAHIARDLAPYPELLSQISNCHRHPRHLPPCGRCPDCVITALAFLGNATTLAHRIRKPNRFRVATLPLPNPAQVDDAFSILDEWSSGEPALRKALSFRLLRHQQAARFREVTRWLGSTVGIYPLSSR